MKIVEAREKHARTIGYIHSTAWCQTYKDIFPANYLYGVTEEKRKQEFLESNTNQAIRYYLIFEGEIAVGIIKIELKDEKTCEISSLYLLEAYRGKGYGTEVIEYIKSVFNGCKIIIWVLEENVKAKLFYEKNNFSLTSQTRKIWRGCYCEQTLYEY
ncbi:ribosomal protein S18 acetylase RimI-like enzyme [Kineothrix alysoides]|uniref:Ribosomal protein S18 acetylase RimI-like enzyme n=1 Tax=Kineothrix alysoides TaxID=1469948 RepID=A0A4R1QRL7_9FIRM|nr:GNAT family N-acetyltransferase [Kineothrix alysoides]TCL55015.1 ribosomal protein S18 acetylase RimI-like enzyme [Kineothrix alysoides]